MDQILDLVYISVTLYWMPCQMCFEYVFLASCTVYGEYGSRNGLMELSPPATLSQSHSTAAVLAICKHNILPHSKYLLGRCVTYGDNGKAGWSINLTRMEWSSEARKLGLVTVSNEVCYYANVSHHVWHEPIFCQKSEVISYSSRVTKPNTPCGWIVGRSWVDHIQLDMVLCNCRPHDTKRSSS